MTLPVYITGTVSVSNLGTVVTGVGCMWSGINAREGDFFTRPDGVAIITEVTDVTHLKITPWPGATIAGGAYAIQQNYVGRVVGVAAAEDVGVMLEKLHVDGLPFIVGTDETVPDPSYGDEGQMAFKPDTGAWWVKSGGVWVPSYGLTALGYGGTSATSILIATGPVTFTTQSGLAYNGARVRAASAANLNNWMEGVASYAGSALAMTADKIHGSGTHADWLLSIGGQPGLDGTGTGDMLAANNLSELTATAPTARKNIYAAPFDALAYNGMQINGNGDVSQEIGATGVTMTASGSQSRPCDGWLVSVAQTSGAVNVTASQVTGLALPGFQNGVKIIVNNSNFTAATVGDAIYFRQVIEGYRMARLGWGAAGALPLTYAMQFFATVAGTIFTRLYNAAANRIYYQEHVIAAGWNWLTATIPGDVTGTWAKDNTAGVYFEIVVGGKETTRADPTLGWQTAPPFKTQTTNSTNLMAASGNMAIITGFVVLPGVESPSAARAPLIMRPYGDELRICERYYQKYPTVLFGGYNAGGAAFYVDFSYTSQMRAAPSPSFAGIAYTNASALATNLATISHSRFNVTVAATGFGYAIFDLILDVRL